MTKPLIVYDLDGTLIDTAPDLLNSLDHITSTQSLPSVDRNILRPHVGFGGRAMIKKAHALAGREISNELLDQLVQDFVEHYANNMPGISKPFPGLIESMTTLREQGCHFAICTNKTEKLATNLLESLDILHWFDAITGQDTFEVRKPHPDHLLKTILQAGGQKETTIMIGDTSTDFSTAKSALIPVIAVEFGYSERPVHEYSPDSIISHYNELTIDLVKCLIKRKKTDT